MCGGGKTKTSQTSSTTAPPSWITDAYKGILGQAQGVSQTPYDPNTEKQVAGFAQPQFQAFDQTQGIQGSYQPYLSSAGGLAAAGSAPISAGAIQNYMDPYTHSVVNATQADFAVQNARQLQDVNSNAARMGALTGDRSQVAQVLAKEAQDRVQAPILAGLRSQGYGQALGAAQQDAGRALQGAQLQGQLGGLAQQYGYNDINALLGIGGLQQGLEQAQFDTSSENAASRAAYPFNTTQWLAGIASGLGSTAGGTTSGTSTTPGPSPWSQAIGLGTAALGFFSDGGAVRQRYAGGGGVLGKSYVPDIEITRGSGIAPSQGGQIIAGDASKPGISELLDSYKQARDAMGGLGNLGRSMRTTTDPESGWSTTVNPTGVQGWSNYLSNWLPFANGGKVRGYDGGGIVSDAWDDEDAYGMPDLMSVPSQDEMMSPWGSTTSVPLVPPPQTGVMAQSAPREQEGGGLFGWTPAQREGLLAAGLGMMASDSPFVGQAIGEGGLAGFKTYRAAQEKAAEEQLAREKILANAATWKERLAQAAQNTDARNRQLDLMEPYRAAQISELKSREQARAKRAAVSDMITRMLGGENVDLDSLPGTSPSVSPQSLNVVPKSPAVQEISAEEAPGGLTLIDDKTIAPSNPQSTPSQDEIDTPYGRMTRQKAMKLGGAMMLDPQYSAAGRALVDLAQGGTTPGLGKEATNKLEEKQLNTTEALARLDNISSQFKPEFQTIEDRLGYKWSELLDSFSSGRASLSDDQKKALADFSAFRGDALNNLNQYIKEITGAAMTNAEADRIMKAMPNPGDGIFNGDSPTVFKAKLDAALRTSKMALARYNYLRRNGFSGTADEAAKKVPLEKMSSIIQQRTDKLLQEAVAANKGMKPEELAPIVRQKLRAEFGVDA